MSQCKYLPVNSLTFPEPVSGGMNPFVLMSLAYMFRSSNEDAEPILVRPSELFGFYTVRDGRHRAVASMIAGRKHVLAVIEDP